MASHRNRGVGLGAFSHRTNLNTSYASHGAALRSSDLEALSTQLSVFQSLLHTFARQHRDAIRKDPVFRGEFARMCATLGVDPFAALNAEGEGSSTTTAIGPTAGPTPGGHSSDGGVVSGNATATAASALGSWSQLWRGKREPSEQFILAIGVRVVDICRARRDENGGLLGVKECRDLVAKGTSAVGGEMTVSEDDILRAVEQLAPLHGGFSIISVGGRQMIRSVPKELSRDQSVVLAELQAQPPSHAFVTVKRLRQRCGWSEVRALTVLEDLVANSLVWIADDGLASLASLADTVDAAGTTRTAGTGNAGTGTAGTGTAGTGTATATSVGSAASSSMGAGRQYWVPPPPDDDSFATDMG